MQTFENDSNRGEVAIKSYHVKVEHTFNQLVALSQNFLKISSCIRAHRCMCHLLIAEKVLYLSAWQIVLTHSPRHCLVSGVGNITVHIIKNSPNINAVDYSL